MHDMAGSGKTERIAQQQAGYLWQLPHESGI
jgi:hypothetical protein